VPIQSRWLCPNELSVYRSWMGWHTTLVLMVAPGVENADPSEMEVRLDLWADSPDPKVRRILREQDLAGAVNNAS
jgi:hypothetical protein